jgi:hypothetical protein
LIHLAAVLLATRWHLLGRQCALSQGWQPGLVVDRMDTVTGRTQWLGGRVDRLLSAETWCMTTPLALREAQNWKLKSYMPLIIALQDYVNSGWTVCILHRVIRAREMVRRGPLMKALEFKVLKIPKEEMGRHNRVYCQHIVQRTSIYATRAPSIL